MFHCGCRQALQVGGVLWVQTGTARHVVWFIATVVANGYCMYGMCLTATVSVNKCCKSMHKTSLCAICHHQRLVSY